MDRKDCLYGGDLIKMDNILPRLREPILSMKGGLINGGDYLYNKSSPRS